MAKISIEINVLNPKEVIRNKKGTFTSVLAGLFMSEEKLKYEVESKVVEQLVLQLKDKISSGLAAEGVIAETNFTIEKPQTPLSSTNQQSPTGF